jgi:hypothetical protein
MAHVTYTADSSSYVACAAAGNTVVLNRPGRLVRLIVTAGTSTLDVFDNASTNSGTKLFTIAATTVGAIYDVRIDATLGIVVTTGTGVTCNAVILS